MPNRPATTGLLLVGHGTRSPAGQQEFLTLAGLTSPRLAPVRVEPAFLELAEPTIAAGLARLVEQGASRIVVLPLLLFAAGHAKQDIPAAVAEAAQGLGRGDLPILQAEHLGCQADILELSRWRVTQALHDCGNAAGDTVAASETCLLLVGRGSRDESATAEMHEFASLRSADGVAATTEVAFIAMAQPSVTAMLPRVAAAGYRRVIVQPHLLFHGELLETLRTDVRTVAAAHPQQEWLLSAHLSSGLGGALGTGCPADEWLAHAIHQRFDEALCRAAIRVVAPSRGG
ncbi:MAG: CbiX/SirB N-terminal domain-containing protein [Pirellulaceae bacterium]